MAHNVYIAIIILHVGVPHTGRTPRRRRRRRHLADYSHSSRHHQPCHYGNHRQHKVTTHRPLFTHNMTIAILRRTCNQHKRQTTLIHSLKNPLVVRPPRIN